MKIKIRKMIKSRIRIKIRISIPDPTLNLHLTPLLHRNAEVHLPYVGSSLVQRVGGSQNKLMSKVSST
jgi:hypothetical protein